MSWWKVALSAFVFGGFLLTAEAVYRRYYANGVRATACDKAGGTLLSTGELVICEYGLKK